MGHFVGCTVGLGWLDLAGVSHSCRVRSLFYMYGVVSGQYICCLLSLKIKRSRKNMCTNMHEIDPLPRRLTFPVRRRYIAAHRRRVRGRVPSSALAHTIGRKSTPCMDENCSTRTVLRSLYLTYTPFTVLLTISVCRVVGCPVLQLKSHAGPAG